MTRFTARRALHLSHKSGVVRNPPWRHSYSISVFATMLGPAGRKSLLLMSEAVPPRPCRKPRAGSPGKPVRPPPGAPLSVVSRYSPQSDVRSRKADIDQRIFPGHEASSCKVAFRL